MKDTLIDLIDAGLSFEVLDTVITDLLENSVLDHDDERYLVALAWGRKNDDQDCIGPDDVSLENGDEVRILAETYRVLNEQEKEDAWEEALESYGKDCVEGYNGSYFDREAWLRDAKMDGAGQTLATYDNEEHEYCSGRASGDVWFYLFRVD